MSFSLFSRFSVIIFLLAAFVSVSAQDLGFERARHKQMLGAIRSDVKNHYFDPNFKGIDIEAKYKAAVERIENATSIGQMNAIIAQFLLDFEDSHLFFIPPGKASKIEYGFEMKMIGDKCFVVRVEPKSDAQKQGLKIGDEIYSMENFAPTRENLWKMKYFYYALRPQSVLKLDITKPDGKEVTLNIQAKITPGKRVSDLSIPGQDWSWYAIEAENAEMRAGTQYLFDGIEGLFIWKMPAFNLEPSQVDEIMEKVRSKKTALILDLRGNGGGRVDMLLRLIGNFFPENIKVGDEKKRKATKELTAKTRGKDAFAGKLVVLIDSESGSASEVFSRVIQLEKRGIVIGDQSAGAVMESLFYSHQVGAGVVAFYGVSVTIADLIMKDGKSLEKTGVMPDEKLIPTPQDLINKNDPVLARAVEMLGFKLSAQDAGKIFPDEDKK